MRFLWTILLLVAISSCKKNAGCTDFGTENYDPEAIVNDGSCILIRDKFLGNFQVSSDCFSSDYSRTISITQDEYVVTISNLADTLGNVEAQVYGNNITIEPQSVHASIIIEGAGVYIEEKQISLSYKIRDSRSGTEVIHDCFELCTKL
ncbi:MAG: hypothetical protein KBF73_07245 [Flavobacteriales bacterium]|nr:hypothetical protein [Flavobacteriales bacterium]